MANYEQEIKRVVCAERDALQTLQHGLNYATLSKIVELLLPMKSGKNRVFTTGCGTSGAAAKKIAHTLSCVEIPASFLSPATAAHGAMGAIQKGDVVIIITKGGNTAELLKLLPCCREKGAIIIGISENEGSVLAKASDIFLQVRVEKEPCPWGMLATASTLAVIAVWDAIAITTMQHSGYTKEEFRRIHPGGAVGEKLSKNL